MWSMLERKRKEILIKGYRTHYISFDIGQTLVLPNILWLASLFLSFQHLINSSKEAGIEHISNFSPTKFAQIMILGKTKVCERNINDQNNLSEIWFNLHSTIHIFEILRKPLWSLMKYTKTPWKSTCVNDSVRFKV